MTKQNEVIRVALVGLVIGTSLILPYLWLWSGIRRMALAGLVSCIYLVLCLPRVSQKNNGPADSVFNILKGMFAVFFIGKCIRDFSDLLIQSNRSIAAFEIAIYLLLILIAWTSGRRVFDGKVILVLSAWAMGIALYAGINFVGSLAGISQEGSAASSLINETRTRMQIPFGPGLNLFGVLVGSGGVFALESLLNSIKERKLAFIVLNLVAFLVNWTVVFLVETRSVILPVLTYIIWNLCKAAKVRAGLALGSLAVLLLTPLLGGLTHFFSYVADRIPIGLQNATSRSAVDFAEFGGRTVIWEYAFQELKAGNFKWFGDGQLDRDTRPMFQLLFQYMPESNTTYHNGFIDLIFVYGPLLGALGSGVLILSIIWAGVVNSRKHGQARSSKTAIAGLLIAISLCTILESSMTLNHFWILLSVLLALQNENQQALVSVMSPKVVEQSPRVEPKARGSRAATSIARMT